VIDFLVSEHLAQSESAKPFNTRELELENKIPFAGYAFKYHRTLVAA
jgi:hypothetical protein